MRRNVRIVTKNCTGEVVHVSAPLTPRGAARRYLAEAQGAQRDHLSDEMEFLGDGAKEARREIMVICGGR